MHARTLLAATNAATAPAPRRSRPTQSSGIQFEACLIRNLTSQFQTQDANTKPCWGFVEQVAVLILVSALIGRLHDGLRESLHFLPNGSPKLGILLAPEIY